MYIMIRTLGKESVQAGEPVVIRYDTPFGRVGAFGVGGRLLGYVDEGAPEMFGRMADICAHRQPQSDCKYRGGFRRGDSAFYRQCGIRGRENVCARGEGRIRNIGGVKGVIWGKGIKKQEKDRKSVQTVDSGGAV